MKRILPTIALVASFFHCTAQANTSCGHATFVDKVLAVGTDSITIQTAAHGGPKITHVGSDGQSITREGPSNVQKLAVGPLCTIIVDGLPGKLADIKKGMTIVVSQGMDPSTAGAINAHTVPPPAKPIIPPKGRKGNGPKPAFRKITSDVVLDFSSTRITVGCFGGKEVRAYYVTPATVVTLDGKRATADDVHLDMPVEVDGDGTRAAAIRLQSPD